jgi:hypothetical protein
MGTSEGGCIMAATRNGEMEWELEGEYEFEGEGEWEGEGEEFIGSIARGIGSLLGGQGQGEFEDEYEFEGDGEMEFEFEGDGESEEFLRRIARGVGSFVRRAAPVLRSVARVAAPVVGTAIGGPLGGAIGRVAASALREGEFEDEYEFEGEGEYEFEDEGEMEATPITQQQALAEYMAAVASRAQTEAEAEAMTGAATLASIPTADRAALQRVLPHMVRGTAILTRILRRRRITRPAVRTVPTIVRRSARTLARRAASGQPVTRRTAARVMSSQTRRVLSNPHTCASAINRNVRASRTAARSTRQPQQSSRQRPIRG